MNRKDPPTQTAWSIASSDIKRC